MKLFAYPFLVASSAAMFTASAHPANRPRYGGTLRVDMQAKVASLEIETSASVPDSDDANRIRELIFDRLVRLDQNGQAQPALALSWEHDLNAARWKFKLRPDVKWQDGATLTPAEVAASLSRKGVAGSIRVAGDTLEINLTHGWPDLLAALAANPALLIRRTSDQSTGSPPIGTGPFRLTGWQPGQSAGLEAYEGYWGGRPFVDKIEILFGRPSRDQMLDLELNRADIAELDSLDAHRFQQEGKRLWTSAAVELLLLHFDLNKAAMQDLRLRQALAGSIDRAAIQKVLTQNFGEVAGGYIPQWLSGYSFLFPTLPDVKQARQIVTGLGAIPTLTLGYEPNDALARQIAERVAVNARDAGIEIQVSPLADGWKKSSAQGPDMRVERVRIDGPTFDEAVLQAEASVGLGFSGSAITPEGVFGAEEKLREGLAELPLVSVPELIGSGPRLRDWTPTPWGDWRLQDVWLDAEKP